MGNPTLPESGHFSTLVFSEDTVLKISKDTFDTEMAASLYATRVWNYGESLAAGPIAVARMLDVGVLKHRDEYRVHHAVQKIPGVSVASIEPKQQLVSLAMMLADLALAASLPNDEAYFAIPVDAKVQNYHLDESGRPVFVDFFPAFGWDDGVVRSGLRAPFGTFEDCVTLTNNYGLRVGAMGRLIASAVEGSLITSKLYDQILPSSLDKASRALVPGEVQRFVNPPKWGRGRLRRRKHVEKQR